MSDDADDLDDDSARPLLKRKDFLDRVAARSGLGPKETRAAVDATLAALAEALVGGHDVAAVPLGKVRLVKERDKPKARVLTLKVAVPKAGLAGLADEGEDG